MEKGEITAFLSLIFVLMISFVTAILESASVQAEKNQARLDMDRAVYSVFGEYQKELLEEYGIFAVEGSYETGNFSEKQLIVRNLAGSRRDSISHRSKRTGISGRRCQIYGRSVWDFDYSRIGGSGRKVGTAGNYRGTDKG